MTVTFYVHEKVPAPWPGWDVLHRWGPMHLSVKRSARFLLGRFLTLDSTPPVLGTRPRRVLAVGREGARVAVHVS